MAKAIEASHEPTYKLSKDGALDPKQVARIEQKFWEQYNHVLTQAEAVEAQKAQGLSEMSSSEFDEMRKVQVRFWELFPGLPDDSLFPLTNEVLEYAPGSSFPGLVLYTSHGKQNKVVARKEKSWFSGAAQGVRPATHSFFRTDLIQEDTSLAANGFHIEYAKWEAIKNRIAFDATQSKIKEDKQLEADALVRYHYNGLN